MLRTPRQSQDYHLLQQRSDKSPESQRSQRAKFSVNSMLTPHSDKRPNPPGGYQSIIQRGKLIPAHHYQKQHQTQLEQRSMAAVILQKQRDVLKMNIKINERQQDAGQNKSNWRKVQIAHVEENLSSDDDGKAFFHVDEQQDGNYGPTILLCEPTSDSQPNNSLSKNKSSLFNNSGVNSSQTALFPTQYEILDPSQMHQFQLAHHQSSTSREIPKFLAPSSFSIFDNIESSNRTQTRASTNQEASHQQYSELKGQISPQLSLANLLGSKSKRVSPQANKASNKGQKKTFGSLQKRKSEVLNNRKAPIFKLAHKQNITKSGNEQPQFQEIINNGDAKTSPISAQPISRGYQTQVQYHGNSKDLIRRPVRIGSRSIMSFISSTVKRPSTIDEVLEDEESVQASSSYMAKHFRRPLSSSSSSHTHYGFNSNQRLIQRYGIQPRPETQNSGAHTRHTLTIKQPFETISFSGKMTRLAATSTDRLANQDNKKIISQGFGMGEASSPLDVCKVSPITVLNNEMSSRNKRPLLLPCEGKEVKETVFEINASANYRSKFLSNQRQESRNFNDCTVLLTNDSNEGQLREIKMLVTHKGFNVKKDIIPHVSEKDCDNIYYNNYIRVESPEAPIESQSITQLDLLSKRYTSVEGCDKTYRLFGQSKDQNTLNTIEDQSNVRPDSPGKGILRNKLVPRAYLSLGQQALRSQRTFKGVEEKTPCFEQEQVHCPAIANKNNSMLSGGSEIILFKADELGSQTTDVRFFGGEDNSPTKSITQLSGTHHQLLQRHSVSMLPIRAQNYNSSKVITFNSTLKPLQLLPLENLTLGSQEDQNPQFGGTMISQISPNNFEANTGRSVFEHLKIEPLQRLYQFDLKSPITEERHGGMDQVSTSKRSLTQEARQTESQLFVGEYAGGTPQAL
ncbi:hypothetical protein FGO68_gene11473 [Halteria grandinella]|uniref:Uncharacterized protein n=1 Tax=Halteria grandinella TaxID=5974 RepID=A0A8J8NZY3_HALGN|nr:hypothetical protein FGO68_gene11473 [Halteria grandinella]